MYIWAFTSSEMGQYCLKESYNSCICDLEDEEIKVPMLRGKCVTDAANYLEEVHIAGVIYY